MRIYAHSALARQAGLSEQAITALKAGKVADDLSPEEIVAQNFARQLTMEHKVDSGLFQEAEKTFGREGLVDMTFLIGIYLYTSVTLTLSRSLCRHTNDRKLPAKQPMAGFGAT